MQNLKCSSGTLLEMVKSIDQIFSDGYQRLMCQTSGGAAIRQQPEQRLMNCLWECRSHLEFAVIFIDIPSV